MYLKDGKIPKRFQLMFAAKATSDDESTPQGPRALAHKERSQGADQLIRAVDHLMLQDLLADGKMCATNNCSQHHLAAFGGHNPAQFQEVRSSPPFIAFDFLKINIFRYLKKCQSSTKSLTGSTIDLPRLEPKLQPNSLSFSPRLQ